MPRAFLLIWVLAAPMALTAQVDATHYDAFWLWGGVKPQAVLSQARTVYVLQGQIEPVRGNPTRVRFLAQGGTVPVGQQTKIWLAYRAHTLRWSPRIYRILLAQLDRWQRAGNRVAGIQIDFDAHTRHIDEYAEFLTGLRQRLPAGIKLGITGLLDWSSQADPSQLAQLRPVVDEIVVQTYQGRHTIPNYASYLPHLDRLGLPFRIGLIQNGEWQPPSGLEQNSNFRGYVIFLLNPARSTSTATLRSLP